MLLAPQTMVTAVFDFKAWAMPSGHITIDDIIDNIIIITIIINININQTLSSAPGTELLGTCRGWAKSSRDPPGGLALAGNKD